VKLINRFTINLITVVLIFSISGCQTAMSTSTSNSGKTSTPVPNEFPLRFKSHGFAAYCYDTKGCSVLYNDDYKVQDDEDKVTSSSASYGPNYQNNWGAGSEVGIRNFPGPVIVKWQSKSGAAHEAKIDIAEIFKDQRILHKVPENEIPEGWAHNISPTIILEVNDNKINVYMTAHIATKTLRDPANKYSDFRKDIILAYSHTY